MPQLALAQQFVVVCGQAERMKLTITDIRIDVIDIPLFPRIDWEPILNELKSVHLPRKYLAGHRMWLDSPVDGKMNAYIYRTDEMPAEPEIRASSNDTASSKSV